MLLTKEVEVTISGRNKNHYINKGYLLPTIIDNRGRKVTPRGTKIKVKVEDLTKGSHVKLLVSCDYCGAVREMPYKEYLKHHDEELGDCCKKCEYVKYRRTMQENYGVDNSFQLPQFIEKAKETNRRNYGYDWHMQRPEYQEIYEEIMQDRYGVNRALQYEPFRQKQMVTMKNNNNSPISKPQKALFDLLKGCYQNYMELEYPCGPYSLDIMIDFDNIKIDVEYDGWFWHQNEKRDRRRDNYVKRKGYKILRVLSNKFDTLPSVELLKLNISTLLNTDTSFIRITM